MQVYAILFVNAPSEPLRAVIRGAFPDNFYEITPQQWLVAANKTAEEIARTLGIGDGDHGQVMILGVSSYYGWHRKDAWDWMSIKRSL